MGKGYKLTSATGDGPKQCAFFASPAGCRNGAACKFSHEANASKTPMSVSSSSVCSSESEGEIVEEKRAGAYASLVKAGDDSNPFFAVTAPPPPAPAAPVAQQSADKKKKRKKSSDNSSPFDLGQATPASQNGTPAPPKKPKTVSTPKQANSLPDFRSLNLPVASFSLPTAPSSPKQQQTTTTSRPPTPLDEPAPPLPLPTATRAHQKWQAAVLATRSHPTYSSAFSFAKTQSYEQSNGLSASDSWITTRPHGSWCKNNPASIAIDCEMCETRHPVTQRADTKALCRLSVVNADNPSEVLLDTLVKPEWPVADYRTWVNGIRKEDLEGVEFTLGHAQMFMNSLCSDQTVIVGHAVHNDLLALKMIHHCNADTAMLYTHKEEENSDGNTNGTSNNTPSLKNLAHCILQKSMPDVHDSVNDARVALACAEHWVKKKGNVEPIEKVFSRSHSNARGSNGERLKSADTCMLLVHRLPVGSTPGHIAEMLMAFTFVKPKVVTDIVFSGKHGKCNVEFTTKEHAELAYLTLSGEEYEDKTGKKQKRVKMKNGDYVCVRKMKKN